MSTAQPPVSRLATRYGTPKPRSTRRTRAAVVWTVLAAAVIGIAVFNLLTGNRPVTSKDVGFSIVDGATASVDFELTKAPQDTAQCAVQVLSESYAIVGWKVVTIPANPPKAGADGGRTTAHRVQLRTESPGVSGGVNACWIMDGDAAP